LFEAGGYFTLPEPRSKGQTIPCRGVLGKKESDSKKGDFISDEDAWGNGALQGKSKIRKSKVRSALARAEGEEKETRRRRELPTA
jgi:hypothetical protein